MRKPFRNALISEPQELIARSCQAERVRAALSHPVVRSDMSREEADLKQLAYERERALWRRQHAGKNAEPAGG